MSRRIDHIGEIRKAHRTPEGYLFAEATVSRTGVLPYRQPDGTIRRELRPRDEVEKSLADLARKPVTLGHPTDDVTPENYRELSVGNVDWKVELAADGWVQTGIQIMDRKAIDAVENGTRELSGGIRIKYDPTPGWWDGREQTYYLDNSSPPNSISDRLERFDGVQREIRHNHYAIVDKARAGYEARLRLDADDAVMVDTESGREPANTPVPTGANPMPSMKLGEATYDVPDNLVGPFTTTLDHERGLATAAETRATTAETALTAAQTAQADVQTKLDAAQGTIDGLEAQRKDAAPFLSQFNERLGVVATAKSLKLDDGKDALKLDEADTADIRKAVIAAKYPTMTLEGRTDEAITAIYETIQVTDPTAHVQDLASALRKEDGTPALPAGAGEDRAALKADFIKGLRNNA